jgi:hypothetical protein
MYGLPPDFDASVFVGARLDSMTFYEFLVLFSFERGEDSLSVGVESSFSFTPDGQRMHVPVEASDAMRHVGRVITSAHAEGDGTLMIEFEGGTALRFFEHEAPYESYSVCLPDGRRVIV